MVRVSPFGPSPIASLPPAAPKALAPQVGKAGIFQDILAGQVQRQSGNVKFSRHAAERIEERGIRFSPEQLAKLENGVERAAGKGARESLMVMDGVAMVVNIAHRTVITCVDGAQKDERVFTNIDSAVLL